MRFRRRYEVVVQGESGSAISQYSVISEHRNERDAREAAALERRRLEMIRAEEAASWVITVVRGDEVIHEERPFGGRRDAVPVPPVGPLNITQREPAADEAPEPEAGDGAAAEPQGAAAAHADEGREGPAEAPDESGEGPADAPDEAGDDGGARTGTIPVVAAAQAAPAEPSAPEAPGETPEPEPAARAHAHAAFTVPDDIAAPADEDAVPAFLAEPAADAAEAGAGGGETGRAARPTRDADIPSGPVPDDVIRRFEESIARERERERGGGRP